MSVSLSNSDFLEQQKRHSSVPWGKFSSGWNWSCPNQDCPDYGVKANINVVVAKIYGKRRIRLLRCRTCQTTFSERRFSPFYGSHADENLILEAMFHLAQGKSIRKVAGTIGVDKDTICRWLDKAALASGEIKIFLKEVEVPEPRVEHFISSLQRRKTAEIAIVK